MTPAALGTPSLRSPKGRPQALSPPLLSQPSPLSKSAPGTPMLCLLSEPYSWRPQLRSPKGNPVAFSPLMAYASHTLSLSTTPVFSVLPEPYKFARTTSATSTELPDESCLGRTASVDERTYSCTAAVRGGVTPGALWDGPALTEDGRAVELDGAVAIHFSHERVLATGEQKKESLKEIARMHLASRRAEAARAAIDAGRVCPVDVDGALHGELLPKASTTGAARAKLLRKKQSVRRRVPREAPVICAGPDGKVFLYLHLATDEECRYRQERKRAGRFHAADDLSKDALVVDAGGLVHLD